MKTLFTCMLAMAMLPAPAGATNNHTDGRTGFEENKGQVRSTTGEAASFVRYRLVQGDARIFLLNSGIAFQFNRTHYPDGFADVMKRAEDDPTQEDAFMAMQARVQLETFRMDMTLEGADPNARTSTSGRSSDYVNYYRYGALDVHRFERVTYHDVYPGIDWVIYITHQGMKYDFVLRPGADPALIRLAFADHEELHVNDAGELIHGNRMGRFTEARPVSHQDGREVSTSFVLEGNTLHFALGDFDATRSLTIDPDRIWGTYYGGNNQDESRATAVDGAGNVYLAGYTITQEDIAEGGHQMTPAGLLDAMLVKFTADGVRLWATYYGGVRNDYGRGCAVDSENNVYLAGYTGSLTGIAFNGHQNDHGDPEFTSNDAFLAKFNSAGVLLWATYYGGVGLEAGRACAVDANDNVYMAGSTQSFTAIASGGHQNTHGGNGEWDAFLVKFNSAGVRQWGTYYGGDGFDGGSRCAVDGTDVYLVGNTAGGDIAMGGHQMIYGGGVFDGYVAKFNGDGVRQWATYYGGDGEDWAEDVAVDLNGNVIVSGYSLSASGIATSGAHQETYGGARDAMLIKFNSAGVRQWATYFGGDAFDFGWTCGVDASGNIAMGGSTSSAAAIALNGHQMTLIGSEDAFLAYFDPNGTQVWGTYYGRGDDDAFESAIDASGNVYLTGTTRSIVDIADGGHQNQFGGDRDAFLVKFEGLSTGLSSVANEHAEIQWLGQQGTLHTVQLGDFRATQLDLLDVSGRVVLAIPVRAAQGRISMDLGRVAPGGYVLRAGNGNTQQVVRLVHQ